MRTMYRVEVRVYTDCEGRYSEYRHNDKYVETIEEAIDYAKTISQRGMMSTGDYRVVERVIDEQMFTVTDKVVIEYDWYKEVGRRKYAEESIARYTQKIAEIEASKVRCRTENGIAKKNKEIEQYKKWIAEEEAIIAES